MLESMAIFLSANSYRELLRVVDPDRSGSIDYEEFHTFIVSEEKTHQLEREAREIAARVTMSQSNLKEELANSDSNSINRSKTLPMGCSPASSARKITDGDGEADPYFEAGDAEPVGLPAGSPRGDSVHQFNSPSSSGHSVGAGGKTGGESKVEFESGVMPRTSPPGCVTGSSNL